MCIYHISEDTATVVDKNHTNGMKRKTRKKDKHGIDIAPGEGKVQTNWLREKKRGLSQG